MISPERARAALKVYRQDPSKFSDDELEMLMNAAGGPTEEPPGATSDYGEKGSMFNLGPTGMDVLEKEIPAAPEAGRAANEAQREAARKKDPKIFQALNLSESFVQPVIPDETPEESARRIQDYEERYFDKSNKTSASQRRDLIREAEHIPERPPPLASPNPLEMFSSSLDKARSNLPMFAEGGMVEHYLEPPLAQFQRDMFPTLGPKVFQMDHNSRAYKEYSDQQWIPILEQAKAEGRAVVRVAYKDAQTGKDKAGKFIAENILGPMSGFAAGADRVMAGLPGRAVQAATGDEGFRANLRRLGETSPVSEFAGEVVGGANPFSPGGMTARAVGGALPAAGAKGLIGATGRGALAGGLSGAATTGAIAASEDRLPTGGELFLGGGLGAVPGGIGGLHKKSLVRAVPEVGVAESTGIGKTDLVSGMKRDLKGRISQEAAEEATGQAGREADYVGGRLERYLTRGARELSAMTKDEIASVKEPFFNMTDDVLKPQTPLLKEAMKLHKEGSYASGEGLPARGPQNQWLRDTIGRASNAEVVPSINNKAITRTANPHSFDLTPEEAYQQGIDTKRVMESYMDMEHLAPGEYMIRVTPKELNPRQTEEVLGAMFDKIGHGEGDPAYKALHRAAGEVRDQFPAKGPIDPNARSVIDLGNGQSLELKGWSAYMREAGKKTSKAQRTLELGGFSKGDTPEKLGGNEAIGQFGSTQSYMQPGHHPDVDKALEELAGLGGAPEGLLGAGAGEKALKTLRGSTGIPTSYRGLLQGGRMRLDPLLQFYGPAFGAVAPSATEKFGTPKVSGQIDPAEVERKRREMGPIFGPFQF